MTEALRRPAISILVPTRDAGSRFASVLEALAACEEIDSAELLVVDSGSTDDTPALAEEHGARVLRIPPEEFGHGRTRNLAASQARAPLLVFLVQDAVPASASFLVDLASPLADPAVAAAYARQLPRRQANPVERYYIGATYPETPVLRNARAAGPATISSLFFSNVASAIRREAWERFPFAEDLVMSEDQEWAGRVLRAGHRIAYQPAAQVVHSHHYSLTRLFRRNFDSGHSLRHVVVDSFLDMAAYELRHVQGGIGYLAREGCLVWLPYFLLWEATRAAGFAIGRHADRLPRAIATRLSLHRDHWRQGDRVNRVAE